MDIIRVKDHKTYFDGEFFRRSDFHRIHERAKIIIDKYGFDSLPARSGVFSAPDLGYFPLASRFARASLSIYFMGVTRGFYEAGAGYVEPWLYNAFHSIELYIKGFLLFCEWYKDIHQDIFSSGYRTHANKIDTKHGLKDLYKRYSINIREIITHWDTTECGEQPDIKELILDDENENVLFEIDEASEYSFRFRYPTKRTNVNGQKRTKHVIRDYWEGNKNPTYLEHTGLPEDSGIDFDHLKTINKILALHYRLHSIASYHEAGWSYFSDLSDPLGDAV